MKPILILIILFSNQSYAAKNSDNFEESNSYIYFSLPVAVFIGTSSARVITDVAEWSIGAYKQRQNYKLDSAWGYLLSGVISGGYAYYAISSSIEYHNPAKLFNEFYSLISEVLPAENINYYLFYQAATIIGTRALFSYADLKLNKCYPRIQKSLNDPNSLNENEQRLIKELLVFLFYSLTSMASNWVSDYFLGTQTISFSRELEDHMIKKIFSSEMGLKLNANNQTRTHAKHLRRNINDATTLSSSLISKALKSSFDGVFHLSILKQEGVLNIIPYVLVYSNLFNFISNYANREKIKLVRERYQILSVIEKLEDDLIRKSALIELNNKREELYKNHSEALEISREYENKEVYWQVFLSSWQQLARNFDFVFKYLFIGYAISNKIITQENRYQIFDSSWGVSNLVSWGTLSPREYGNALFAINATKYLLKIMQETKAQPSFDFSYLNNFENPKIKLELKNISVGYGDLELINLNYLNLNSGIYVITGKSGTGKSTFLRKLKDLKYSPGWAKGEVIFSGNFNNSHNHKPKIMMATQEDFIASYSDSHEMSGGEKKKAALEFTLNQNPDILILDEIFNGMDSNLIKTSQDLIKDRMKDKIVLIVDHEFEAHNKNKFYDSQIDFN